MKKMSNKVYIYNWEQALFYMNNGLKPIQPPAEHRKTKKVFFVFNYYEAQQGFTKWIKKQ